MNHSLVDHGYPTFEDRRWQDVVGYVHNVTITRASSDRLRKRARGPRARRSAPSSPPSAAQSARNRASM